MNIYIYTPLEKDLQSYLKNQLSSAFDLTFRTELGEQEAHQAFQKSEIILGNPPSDWFKSVPANLAFWQLDSAGFDQYNHLKLNISVANMGSFFSQACAETIVGGALAFYRRLPELILAKNDKKWIKDKIRIEADLLGTKEVIILGAGSIGMAVKQILAGFGCKIKIAARTNPEADYHSIEEVLVGLEKTDLVINTLPGAASNYASSDFFDAMKTGSVYASVGRGNTTDETALLTALNTGKLAGAVLDVTAEEPLPENHILWKMENVILTQHTGGGKTGENKGKIDVFLSNFNKYLNKEQIEDLIDLRKGY